MNLLKHQFIYEYFLDKSTLQKITAHKDGNVHLCFVLHLLLTNNLSLALGWFCFTKWSVWLRNTNCIWVEQELPIAGRWTGVHKVIVTYSFSNTNSYTLRYQSVRHKSSIHGYFLGFASLVNTCTVFLGIHESS